MPRVTRSGAIVKHNARGWCSARPSRWHAVNCGRWAVNYIAWALARATPRRRPRIAYTGGMSVTPDSAPRAGVNFVIVHCAACVGERCHYSVARDGMVRRVRAETQALQHADALTVALVGPFVDAGPGTLQVEALHGLLFDLRRRHPGVRVAGHRQLKNSCTDCPGPAFPLTDLVRWSRTTLIEALDPNLQQQIDRQYNPV